MLKNSVLDEGLFSTLSLSPHTGVRKTQRELVSS